MSQAPKFVMATFEIDCQDNRPPPIYRIWLGDQLFTERTFDFQELWLEETLQIMAPPGEYILRIECLNKNIDKLKLWNFNVAKGPAEFQPREDHTSAEIVLEVHDESP